VPLLRARDLTLHYRTKKGPVRAVDSISFEIEKGTTLALVGESGCGKTSTASAILRILPRNVDRYEGELQFRDTDIMKLSDEEFRKQVRWSSISIVFQGAMNALNPTTQVGSQVAEPLLIHKDIKKLEAMDEVVSTLRRVGLPEYIARRYPHELSGGMKQRVVIAMALVMKPDLVILDEPTSALDVMTQANIMNLLKELQVRQGLSYIFITHDLGLSSELADKIGIMYAGQLVEVGSPDEIYRQAQHPYTRMLMSSAPRLRDEETPQAIPGGPPNLVSPPRGCRFHPRCPYAFKPCGWIASDLIDRLRDELIADRGTDGSPIRGFREVKAQSEGQLALEFEDGAAAKSALHPLESMLAELAGRWAPIGSVDRLSVENRWIVLRLTKPQDPVTLLPAHGASCWLLEGAAT